MCRSDLKQTTWYLVNPFAGYLAVWPAPIVFEDVNLIQDSRLGPELFALGDHAPATDRALA